jgi:NAD+ synthase (glutamine-hydrolysing)
VKQFRNYLFFAKPPRGTTRYGTASSSCSTVYSYVGFIRAAVCLPHVHVADPQFNTKRTLALAQRASDANAALALFPELGVSGYSNEDLFHQDVFLDATRKAVALIVEASIGLSPVLLVGAPLRFEGKLFNCAVVIYRGKILGIVPKTYLPNYREFYEKREFNSGRNAVRTEQPFLGRLVPFGNDLVFEAPVGSECLAHWRGNRRGGTGAQATATDGTPHYKRRKSK